MMHYIADFECGCGDLDLAARLWRGLRLLRRIDKTKPITAMMLNSYCVLAQDGPDEWTEEPPFGKEHSPTALLDECVDHEITAIIAPTDNLRKLLEAFEPAFNKYSINTIMALLRDWRARKRAKRNH